MAVYCSAAIPKHLWLSKETGPGRISSLRELLWVPTFKEERYKKFRNYVCTLSMYSEWCPYQTKRPLVLSENSNFLE